MILGRRVLVEGRAGSGKSTVAERLIDLLARDGIAVSGFLTREIREGRRRVGFGIETTRGRDGVLAHVDLPGPPRVGRYGVDLAALEAIALPAIARPADDAVTVIDELGKMELASERFREAVARLFERPVAVVATVHAHPHPFTDALKRRDDVELERVTPRNRDALPRHLAARFT